MGPALKQGYLIGAQGTSGTEFLNHPVNKVLRGEQREKRGERSEEIGERRERREERER